MSEPDSQTPGEKFLANLVRLADRSGSGVLLRFVAECSEHQLFDLFKAADREASRLQKRHKFVVHAAVWPSALALAIGIFQLGVKDESRVALWVEAGLIAITGVAVAIGHYADLRDRWLLARYQAERFRLLIFDEVVRPGLWAGDAGKVAWYRRAKSSIDAVEALTVDALKTEAQSEPAAAVPRLADCKGVSARPVVDFYSEAWLNPQLEYFRDKVKKAESRHWDRPSVAMIVFALTIIVVLLHVLSGLFEKPGWSHGFLLIAALIPAAFTAVRTVRSALELARNASRARAKQSALASLSDSLQGKDDPELTAEQDRDWHRFRTLALCQAALHNEQREWLRLMLETEWFS